MKQSVMDQVVRVSRSFHPGTHLASLCVDVPRARAASLVLRALAGEAAAASKQTTPGLRVEVEGRLVEGSAVESVLRSPVDMCR